MSAPCAECALFRQAALNGAVFLDLLLNTILGGSPREAVSRRTARARAAGSKAAAAFCAVLTWVGRNVFGADRDHCTWSLDDSPSIAAEIWHWSPPAA